VTLKREVDAKPRLSRTVKEEFYDDLATVLEWGGKGLKKGDLLFSDSCNVHEDESNYELYLTLFNGGYFHAHSHCALFSKMRKLLMPLR